MVHGNDRTRSQGRLRVWRPPPSTAFATPKGLNSVALAVLATALLVLTALIVYVCQRRRLRALGARSRRGKNAVVQPQQLVEAEIVVDSDFRRGSRTGLRRNLPWPLAMLQRPARFSDAPHGFSLPLQLENLWNRIAAPTVEPPGDEVAELTSYSDGWNNGNGPRFLATTASGKSLQVVVKTAAVTSRQQKQPSSRVQYEQDTSAQHSRDWPAPHEAGVDSNISSRAVAASSATHVVLATSPSFPLTSKQVHGSGQSDVAGASIMQHTANSLNAATSKGQGLRAVASSSSFTAAGSRALSEGPSIGGMPNDGDDEEVGRAPGPTPSTLLYITSVGSTRPGGVSAEGTQPTHGDVGLAPGAAAVPCADGGLIGAAAAASAPFGGRGSDNDPAVAWYSRALHRQMSAAAAAAQVTVGTSKAHLA